jgi:hypothetical protein
MLPSRNATSETVIPSRMGPQIYTVATSISAASWVSQARNPSASLGEEVGVENLIQAKVAEFPFHALR